MRISRWQPEERADSTFQRPWLEAPSPYDYLPVERPRAETANRDEDDEDEPRRVIIIEI
jgi:hypothetical protein